MKPQIPGRLHAQGLTTPRFATPADVVRHLGCVQAQLHDMALWSVARRTPGLTLAELQASFDRGDFLRTHVLRPTWHLVDPEDLHWLLALTAPRVRRLLASADAASRIDPALADRCAQVMLASLADGQPRTRAELAADLEAEGLAHSGQALAHLVMHAEIDALIASGPMRGKQHTYVALEPRPVPGSYDELLATAARRYALGHGPFRDRDLAWWTSLTLTDSRRAIESAHLRPLAVDGDTYWRADEPVDVDVPRLMLLSNFDEYISYARDPDDFADYGGRATDIARVTGLLMVDGRLGGSWARSVTARTVDITVRPSVPITASLRRALEAEIDAYGRFLERPPVLTVAST
ncbi:MAG: hypothetical protein JWR27_2352 [Aeromicrobium sp.]|nr:hypothetical protein [Aeromicrobium sp.]